MLNVNYTVCHYAECHYAECNYAECQYSDCHYTECHYTECRGAARNRQLSDGEGFFYFHSLFF